MSASRAYIWLSVVVTIVSGTFSAVATKALYQLKTDGLCGENTFSKAYMTTLWMFIGEALCLVYYFADKWWRQFRGTELKSETEEAPKKPPLWNFVVLSLFDLSATAIGGVGLFWVTASANQMLRGSAVLFTGIFTFLILKRRLATRKWIGIGIVICGLVLVGGSAALQAHLDEENGKSNSDNDLNATPSQAILGVVLVLVGSALNSAQGVFEEKLMKGTDIDPLEVVGWEGVSGMVLCSFALLPITEAIPGSDCGSAESTTDSLLQIHRNPLIVGLLVLFAVSLAFMNYFSQVISKHLSAVHRMLINTLRTVLVWVVSIMLFYVFTHESFGEPWVVTSYMQLGGFALLIIGTFVYGMTAEVDKKSTEGDDATTRLVAPDAIVPSDTDEESAHDYAYSHSYQNGKTQDNQ